MKHSFRSDVNNVKNLVKEKYQFGLPLLKELIQNANDAGAKNLIIGFEEKTKDFCNPLLNKCPGMYVINDSEFTSDNAYAIYQAAESSKKNEFTIGKFGLGLKSLYNYSEGYFYICNNVITGEKKNQIYNDPIGLITPWETDDEDQKKENPYNEWWEKFDDKKIKDSDHNKLLEIIRDKVQNFKQWFALWVPLRTIELIKENEFIKDKFWKNQSAEFQKSIITNDIIIKISQILPMMNSLKRILIYDNKGNETKIEKTLGENLSLRQMKKQYENKNYEIRKQEFTVKISNNGSIETEMTSLLNHSVANDEFIHEFVENIKANKKEKNVIPHYGILLTENKNVSNIDLRFHHSCLLPLTKEDNQELSKYNLFLHSLFFLDSSRTAPFMNDLENSSESLKKEIKWNERLKKNATRLIIPTIYDFITSNNTNNENIIAIVKAIKGLIDTDTLRKNDVCNKLNLLNRIYLNDSKWETQNCDKKFFKIPHFQIKKIRNSFVEKFLEENVFVFENFFYGLGKDAPSNWTKEMFLQWMDIPFEKLLQNDELSKLWLSVISLGEYIIQEELVVYLRKVFNEFNWTTLKKNKKMIEDILENLEQEFKIFIDLPKYYPQKYFLPLFQVQIKPILLNQDFYDADKSPGYLQPEDCIKLINSLKIEDEKRLSKLALSLIKVVKEENINVLLEKIENHKLFIIKDKTNNDSLISYKSLIEKQDHSLLFSAVPGIYKEFSQTIKNCEIGKLLDNEIKEILSLSPIGCSTKTVLEFVSTNKPDLQIMNKRLDLFSKFKITELNENEVKAIRYLLHSQRDFFDDLSLLFISSNDSWSNLLFLVLKKESKEWTIVHKKQIKQFNLEVLDNLNIQQTNQYSVQNFLNNCNNLSNVNCDSLAENDRNNIIEDYKDIEKLRQLPIFEDVSGKLVSISKDTFIVGADFDIPLEIQQNLTFIKENKIIVERQICDKLSANKFLEILFENPEPEKYWKNIKNSILKVSDISDVLRKQLREESWIPLKDGNFGSLDLLIYQKDLENIISEINDGSIYDYKMLNDEVKEKKTWDKIENLNLLNNEKENLDILRDILVENSDNHFGDIADGFNKQDFDNFLNIFDSDNEIFPVIRIINQIKEKIDSDLFNNNFIPKFFTGIPTKNQFITIFKFLQQKEEATKKDKKQVMKLFYLYLEQLNSVSNAKEILEKIQLKNEENNWCSTDKLCANLKDISLSYLVQEKIVDILDEIIITSRSIKSNNKNNNKTNKIELENYFDELAEKTSTDLVGLFLSCFNKKEYIALANEKYLTNNRNVKQIRVLLNESWYKEKNTNNQWNINNVLEKENFDIQIQNKFNDEYSVRSIIATTFKVKKTDFKIRQNLHIVNDSNNLIILKDISNEQNKKIMLDAFHNTFISHICNLFSNHPHIEIIDNNGGFPKYSTIRHSFPIYHEKLEELWDKLSHADQNTILQIQKQIVEHIIPTLQVLKIDNEDVENLFQINDERLRYEMDGGIKKLPMLKENFLKYSKMIFNIKKVKKNIFFAVKEKLNTFQYDEKSVIFELFQNADDAVSELLEMELTPIRNEFIVNLENKTLSIMHWGRKINQDRGGSLTVEKNKKRRYNDDVLKMLSIGYSRKGDNQTGKFGLGFKSIYSICESPKILSGQLGFQISGAIFPSNLDDITKKRLQKKLPDFRSGTIIEMDLLKKNNEIIDDFEKYAYLQTCFSKNIRNIKINNTTFSNKLEPVLKIKDVSKVKIDSENYGLLFKSKNGSILFKLDSTGFCKFPKEIPSIWVTVPTREEDELGFIINASFDLDVGRTQLTTKHDRNFEIAQKLGKCFYEKISELFVTSENDFEEFKENLNLSINTSSYEFWESVFNIMTSHIKSKSDSKSIDIAFQIMWHNKNGYYGFINENRAIPNGYSGKNKDLISLSELKYKITGILSKKIELLNKFFSIANYNTFDEIKFSGISNEIFSKLPIIYDRKIENLKLIDFIKKILNKKEKVSIENANKLGCFLTDKLFKDIQNPEKENLKKYLKKLRFKSLTNQYTLSNEILIMDKEKSEEEFKRGLFAPDEFILDDNYSEEGINFVIFCRCGNGFSADTDKLSNWAIKADTEGKQIAVLSYILNGKLNTELKISLKKNYQKSFWLKQLKEEKYSSPLLSTFYDQEEILSSLGFTKERFDYEESEEEPIFEPQRKIDWQEILKHWKNDKEYIINNYENKIYPSFFNKKMITDASENKEVRRNWMILFLLGISHTFGFDNQYSNKNFINYLEDNNLLVFISNYEYNQYKDTEYWFKRIVDPIFNNRVNDRYRIWLNALTDIYKISKHLSTYIRRFSNGLKFSKRTLNKILAPRSDYEAYEDIPSLESTLNMGANFIIRELVRFNNGEVENTAIYEECFVPKRQIRRICNLDIEKGSFNDSKHIYNFVAKEIGEENVTFDFCFDIAISDYLN